MTSRQYQIPSQNYDPYVGQLENISKRERHGLFTQPPPLSIGDKFDDAFRSRGSQKPILTNPGLKGNHEPSLFQQPNYISINDPYKESFKQKQISDKERVMAITHQVPFKPSDGDKKIVTSEYEHKKEFDDKVYSRRAASGKVRTESRNFLTNPSKKGLGNITYGHLFSHTKYISDPFDRFEDQDRVTLSNKLFSKQQERIQHRSKFLHQNTGFYSTSHGNRPFTADRQVFDGSGYRQQPGLTGTFHKYPFRPSNPNKAGYPGCFERIEYLEEGGDPDKTKRCVTNMNRTQQSSKPWRPNSFGTFSRPQPSITQKSIRRGSNVKKQI